MAKKKSAADNEWVMRTLCSDESCIGVIGPDGRCMECNRPYEGKLPEGFGETPDAAGVPEQGAAAQPEGASVQPVQEARADSDPISSDGDDWDSRTLCSDESCIGVIGADGRCMECGKPYTG